MVTIQREVRRRGIIGKLFKWLFVLFNILMAVWLIAYWRQAGGMIADANSEAARAGGAIGTTIGTGVLLFLWAAGDVIIGALAFFTRGKAIYVTEEVK